MNNDDAQKQPEAPTLTGEVGNQLRKAREAKGMSIAQVADAQHLRSSVIQSIEDGQYEKIGSELFLKGYVRTYAEQVGLNPAEMIEKLDWELEPLRQQAEDEQRENPLETIERRKQQKRRIARWTMLCILAVAIALVGVRLLDSELLPIGFGPEEMVDEPAGDPAPEDVPATASDGTDSAPMVNDGVVGSGNSNSTAGSSSQGDVDDTAEETSAPTDVAEPEASGVEPQDETPAIAPEPAQPEEPTASQEPPATSQQPDSSPEPAESQEPLVASPAREEVDEPVQTQGAGSESETASAEEVPITEETPAAANADLLTASFTGDCWVSVENGAGQTVIASLKRAGDTLRYEGQGPFRVVLGAADAATLSFNGEAVDLSRYPAPNNRVALTLGN